MFHNLYWPLLHNSDKAQCSRPVYYFVGKECVREKKKSSFYLNGDSLEWKHSRILSVNRYKKKKSKIFSELHRKSQLYLSSFYLAPDFC